MSELSARLGTGVSCNNNAKKLCYYLRLYLDRMLFVIAVVTCVQPPRYRPHYVDDWPANAQLRVMTAGDMFNFAP